MAGLKVGRIGECGHFNQAWDNSIVIDRMHCFTARRHTRFSDFLFSRDNYLISLPLSLSYHPTVEVILLDGNLLFDLPPLLQTIPHLHTLSLEDNPLVIPPPPTTDHEQDCETMMPAPLVKRELLRPDPICMDSWGRKWSDRLVDKIKINYL